jgi:hypothetical protein
VLRSNTLAGVRLRDRDRVVSPPSRIRYTFRGADGGPALGKVSTHDVVVQWWATAESRGSCIQDRNESVYATRTCSLHALRHVRLSPSMETGDRYATLVWGGDVARREFGAVALLAQDGAWSLLLNAATAPGPLGTCCYGRPGVKADECVASGGVYDRPCQPDTNAVL